MRERRRKRDKRRLATFAAFDSIGIQEIAMFHVAATVNDAINDFFRRNPELEEAMQVSANRTDPSEADNAAWQRTFSDALAKEPGWGDSRDKDGWPVFADGAEIIRSSDGDVSWAVREHLSYDRADENPGGAAPDYSAALDSLLECLSARHPSRVISSSEMGFDAPEGVGDIDAMNGRFRVSIDRDGDGMYTWSLWKGSTSHAEYLPVPSFREADADARRFVAGMWDWAVVDYHQIELGFVDSPVSRLSSILSNR